jgi:6-pyruvoyltetrahydropterin/6-carboxytetrahydropterin synthase
MQEVLGPFDHRVLNEVPPFDRRNTTAELLAQHVHDEVSRRLPGGSGSDPLAPRDAAGRIWVARVEVWENDASCAAYELEPVPASPAST